ncbi:MAG TPA: phosphoribosyltransferase family protein [Kofleriaceae bacterium]|nr:phosphoribosyltransferase family protein [Kofleriaceae bacterium]
MSAHTVVGDVFDALPSRRGHFVLESGYHTDLWITLDALFVEPVAMAPHVAALAERLRGHAPTAICGPQLGGAFLAQAVATDLSVKFFVMELAPAAPGAETAGLFTARYRLPPGQVPYVRGQRVAVVDDVISAGSSVRAAIAGLSEAGASIVAVGALFVLGDAALRHFEAQAVPVERLGERGLSLWPPTECALCRAGAAIERV